MKRKIGLLFPQEMSNKPVICGLTKRFDLMYNILRAKVDVGMVGKMIMEMEGDPEVMEAAVMYLQASGIVCIPMPESAAIDRNRCVECGACTAVCPTRALYMSPEGALMFKNELCLLCGACRPACPLRAITTQEELGFD